MAYFELGWTQPHNEVVGCSGTNLASWIHEQSDSSQWLDIKEPHDGGFQGLRKVRGNRDQCEGMTVIVSFRAWCLQVRVIREVHFPPLSVGVDVCTLWRAVFRRVSAADYKGVAAARHPNVTHERQKCGSTKGASASFRYFAFSLTDGMGPSVALAMRSAVASKDLCNLQKHHRLGESDCLPDTQPTKRASEALMKGR